MENAMNEEQLLQRITTDANIYGGKPIIRGRRLAVEHILDLLEAGDTEEDIMDAYDWLEPEDIEACILFDQRSRNTGTMFA
jgi:uncharacterized protein (DUF433 family)